ncbi:MAG: hypothetical protein K0V04_15330 [Deltaproteobacteria bacterium]|nr:hypothetical protein [Deltaproteobacteria bacterium]
MSMTLRLSLTPTAAFGLLLVTGCPGSDPVPADTEAATDTGDDTTGAMATTSTPPSEDSTTTDEPPTEDSTSTGDAVDSSGSSTGDGMSTTTGDAESSSGGASVCGDAMITGNEQCDGKDLDGADCISEGFNGGDLACNEFCLLDFTDCEVFSCGDGMLNGPETCDAAELGGQTCLTQGFDNGSLLCEPNCMAFDTSGCGTCGDGQIDAAETCDSANLGGQSCASQGFTDGNLACNAECTGYNTNACTLCGDGAIEGAEDCEGNNLGGQTCQSQGFDAGVLACDAACNFNAGACFDNSTCCAPNGSPGCSDPGVEACVCAMDPFCCSVEWDGLCVGQATADCNAVCVVCGNGNIDMGEICDGNQFGGASCQSQGFDNGSLSCQANCSVIDNSGCGICGNGAIDPAESCDGGNLGGASCQSLGFDGGNLSCTGNCGFNTSNCVNTPSWSGQIQPIWNGNCGCHQVISPVFSNVPSNTAYNNLVNVGSSQVALDFIEPGQPNNSYIIHKMEGTQAVGGSMPDGQPLLPQATVDIIRDWIDAGAPNN